MTAPLVLAAALLLGQSPGEGSPAVALEPTRGLEEQAASPRARAGVAPAPEQSAAPHGQGAAPAPEQSAAASQGTDAARPPDAAQAAAAERGSATAQPADAQAAAAEPGSATAQLPEGQDSASAGTASGAEQAAGDARTRPGVRERPPDGRAGSAASPADLEGLRTELDALTYETSELQAALAAEQARVEALEDELREERAAASDAREAQAARDEEAAAEREAAARSPAARADTVGGALAGMDGALQSLAAGDPSGLDAALAAQAAALAAARAEAGRRGASHEASQAGAGAALVEQARAALARGDLYSARLALGQAGLAAARARGLAREEALGSAGVQGPPPDPAAVR